MTKVGRNDPCPCGSGKKYKKCCEPKESVAKKLVAHKIESEELTHKASSISGLFQKMNFPQPPPKEEEEKPSVEENPEVIPENPPEEPPEKP